MAYDEEQHKRSRVVIETPTARREVVQTTTARAPERRSGVSAGVVAALVIGSVALVTLLFLFILNRQNTATEVNANVRSTTAPTPVQQPMVVQQPAPVQQQPPIIIQQPGATTTTQPPV